MRKGEWLSATNLKKLPIIEEKKFKYKLNIS